MHTIGYCDNKLMLKNMLLLNLKNTNVNGYHLQEALHVEVPHPQVKNF